MQYEIKATLVGYDNYVVFNATMNYYPRKGEEIEIGSNLFVVENVTHIIKEGTHYRNYVHLKLKQIK